MSDNYQGFDTAEQFQEARAKAEVPAIGYSDGQIYFDHPEAKMTLEDELVGLLSSQPGCTIAGIIPEGPDAGTYNGFDAMQEMFKKLARALAHDEPFYDPIIKITIDGLIDGVPGRVIYRQTTMCPHWAHSHWVRVD